MSRYLRRRSARGRAVALGVVAAFCLLAVTACGAEGDGTADPEGQSSDSSVSEVESDPGSESDSDADSESESDASGAGQKQASASGSVKDALIVKMPPPGTYKVENDLPGGHHGALTMLLAYCRVDADAVEPTDRAKRQFSQTGGNASVYQEAFKFRSGQAAKNFADLKKATERCDSFGYGGDPSHKGTLAVTDTDFVGDASMLVVETDGGKKFYHVVARVGDFQTRIRTEGVSEETARKVAASAVAGLCRASGTC